MKIIITKGLPGSGKTTWAKNQVATHPGQYKRINKDDLRSMLDNSLWSKSNEKLILEIRGNIAHKVLAQGMSVIIDDTNFDSQHEATMRSIAAQHNAEFEIKDFTDIPLQTCIENDLKRPNSVGKDVIMKMYNRYLKPRTQPIEQNPDLPDAYQYDLDGTLALYDNPNSIKSLNYNREFIYDRVNYPVLDQLRMQQKAGYKIVILSGRNGEHEAVTKEWFGKHDIQPDLFVMRSIGDMRKDFEVKEEMFKRYVLPNYYINAVYDDRNQVVNKWREMGLTCFQVAEGSF